jgi:hypothetical protein
LRRFVATDVTHRSQCTNTRTLRNGSRAVRNLYAMKIEAFVSLAAQPPVTSGVIK